MGQNPSAPDGGYRTPAIAFIRPHHRAMARMMAAGATPKEVCNLTGFTPGQMSRIQASPSFQAYLKELEEAAEEEAADVQKQLLAMQSRALEVLDMDLEMEVGDSLAARRHRLNAANSVLDRTIGKKSSGDGGNHLHIHDHKELHHHEGMSTEELARKVLDMTMND